MPPHKILFVDDEQFKVGKWKRRLAKDYEVVPLSFAEEVLQYFEDHLDVMAIVLDFMMPTPPGVPESLTEGSLATGAYILERLRKKIINLPCPVVILTNRELKIVQEIVDGQGFPKGLIVVCSKRDTNDEDLAILVGRQIARWCNLIR